MLAQHNAAGTPTQAIIQLDGVKKRTQKHAQTIASPAMVKQTAKHMAKEEVMLADGMITIISANLQTFQAKSASTAKITMVMVWWTAQTRLVASTHSAVEALWATAANTRITVLAKLPRLYLAVVYGSQTTGAPGAICPAHNAGIMTTTKQPVTQNPVVDGRLETVDFAK